MAALASAHQHGRARGVLCFGPDRGRQVTYTNPHRWLPGFRMLALTVEPLRELTSSQLRQLDDEAGLVGAVMEATPTLTLGPVTVGAHA